MWRAIVIVNAKAMRVVKGTVGNHSLFIQLHSSPRKEQVSEQQQRQGHMTQVT